MSNERLTTEHCKNIGKTELHAYMPGQGMRQLQTFVYFLDVIALQNIYITYGYFHVLTAHSVIKKKRQTSTAG